MAKRYEGFRLRLKDELVRKDYLLTPGTFIFVLKQKLILLQNNRWGDQIRQCKSYRTTRSQPVCRFKSIMICPGGQGEKHVPWAIGVLSQSGRGSIRVQAAWSTRHIWEQDSESYLDPVQWRNSNLLHLKATSQHKILSSIEVYYPHSKEQFCHFPESLPSGTKHMSHPRCQAHPGRVIGRGRKNKYSLLRFSLWFHSFQS